MSLANATFSEILDDLSCRFIINIPSEESLSVERIGFQIEEAHWFYEDFIRESNPSLPNFTLKVFSSKLFSYCPLLHKWANEHDDHYLNFLNYKLSVPVCGAIILNKELDKCVCVKGYNNRSTWGFPRGKIDIDEEDESCAIREVKEEIGFDLTPYITKKDYIQIYVRKQRIKLFIIPCIPEHLTFKPLTRKEISRIQWFPLDWFPSYKNPKQVELAQQDIKLEGHGRFYLIGPFMSQLNKWVKKYRNSKEYKIAFAKSDNVKIINTNEDGLEIKEQIQIEDNESEANNDEEENEKQKLIDEARLRLVDAQANYKISDFNDFKFDLNLIMAKVDSVLYA